MLLKYIVKRVLLIQISNFIDIYKKKKNYWFNINSISFINLLYFIYNFIAY